MGIVEWFTGRNSIYKDSDKVNAAKDELNKIKTNEISAAKEAVSQALYNCFSAFVFTPTLVVFLRTIWPPLAWANVIIAQNNPQRINITFFIPISFIPLFLCCSCHTKSLYMVAHS